MILVVNVLSLLYKSIMMWKKCVLLTGYIKFINTSGGKVTSDKVSWFLLYSESKNLFAVLHSQCSCI